MKLLFLLKHEEKYISSYKDLYAEKNHIFNIF